MLRRLLLGLRRPDVFEGFLRRRSLVDDRANRPDHANGIFGDRSSTPEQEVIFFSKDGNDFILTWFEYGEVDYASIFEEMGKSLRFTTPENTDAQNP